jgi:hypothetical protein
MSRFGILEVAVTSLTVTTDNVQNGTDLRRPSSQSSGMKSNKLTRKLMTSVPCPTCGVAARMCCILYSGGLRFEPHVARKLSAEQALERK